MLHGNLGYTKKEKIDNKKELYEQCSCLAILERVWDRRTQETCPTVKMSKNSQ